MEMLELEEEPISGTRIKVIGIGGCGCNVVDRMVEAKLSGVELIAINTDLQALQRSCAAQKICMGRKVTRGLSAGSDPEIGRNAAYEDREEIREALLGADMVFIAAGLGGGTGTGAAPICANISRELHALTVGIVAMPFTFEGHKRLAQAEIGLRELKRSVDLLIALPNQKLACLVSDGASMADAFDSANDVLMLAVQSISDLITQTGLINLDFADIKTVMGYEGGALLGFGSGSGANKALQAVREAISHPLLEEQSIQGARGILVNISGGQDLTLSEVIQAMAIVHEAAEQDADIIFGAINDIDLAGKVRVTIIATGLEEMPERVMDFETLASESMVKASLSKPLSVNFRKPPSGSRAMEAQIKPHLDDNLSDLDVPTFIRQRGHHLLPSLRRRR
jgi:cell division protein FtsZ